MTYEREMPEFDDPQDMAADLEEVRDKISAGRDAAYERGQDDYEPGVDAEAAANESGFEGQLRNDYLDGWYNSARETK